ncbi:hypothetical protein LVJ82_00750 [Vitreoscilla massiliensis]|uniref:Uncharacterized protein n=1 Tax=Vitreoscilla massiliensis TaxID=1689272 RepID=A0ABY4E175_9NEIS|nr:hypothetical protein [Vitreoscilla massiliensis]UOO89544.1 hypothetical protein LVJ82_00750 [Vitreoscilla massiliensis]
MIIQKDAEDLGRSKMAQLMLLLIQNTTQEKLSEIMADMAMKGVDSIAIDPSGKLEIVWSEP